MDEKELAKQFVNYADAVTAFAFVQGAAFRPSYWSKSAIGYECRRALYCRVTLDGLHDIAVPVSAARAKGS